jgi:hypothetical protein
LQRDNAGDVRFADEPQEAEMNTGPAPVRSVDGGTDADVDAVLNAYCAGDTDRYLALCASDVLLELVVPTWRFQVVGHEALRETLKGEFLDQRQITELHVTRTADGVLIDAEAKGVANGAALTWWALHHVRIDGGLIVEHIAHCSGMLDEHQLGRQANEAPMVRSR